MSRTVRALCSAALGVLLALLPPLASAAWWNKDWTTRTRITLDTSAAGVETKESVNGLVVAVRLHSGNFDFTAAKEDGSDLRVLAADDKTPLPFAVERYDGINELGLLWVALPAIVPGSDKNTINVYAGNAKAAAEPSAQLYASGVTLLAHFGESEGPAGDEVRGLKTEAPVSRENNGLLGAAARLAGEAIVWPAPEPAAAGAPLTIAFWIKPDSVASGTLLQWGALRVGLAEGRLVAGAGAARVEGGTLPPASWAHVGLVAASGKLALYVNGAKAAEADTSLREIAGPVRLGPGYAGLFDELQILPAQRGADALKLLAASQGADGKLVKSVRESSAESGDASPGYLGILVKNLTTDAWVVIIILALMFVLAAWVMVTKAAFVTRTDRDNRGFLQRFRAATTDLLHLGQEGAPQHPQSSLYRLYQSGVRELKKRNIGSGGPTLSGAALNAMKASIDADLVRESHRLNSSMVLLTIAISGGPFLGLLGTVAGVMITFAAIAAAGDVNVNAIAPGIASALLATVAGLVVAIPALFGYNYLASRIKNISADMQIFVDEFVTRVDELYGQR